MMFVPSVGRVTFTISLQIVCIQIDHYSFAKDVRRDIRGNYGQTALFVHHTSHIGSSKCAGVVVYVVTCAQVIVKLVTCA